MKNERKKGIIYARQSSGSDDFSESVERQIENCKRKAEKEGVEIIGIYQDLNTSGKTYPCGAEAVAASDGAFNAWYAQQTGSKMFREGLGNVISRLSGIDYIIVDEMTRLYRPVTRSYLEGYINQKVTENGVKILQAKGAVVDLTQFDQALIQTLKNAIQDEAIKNQKAKAKAQFDKMRNSGVFANGGGKAWGMKKAGNALVFEEDKKEVITYIFAEVCKYTPYAAIIRHINENFGRFFRKCFYTSNFYNIVKNPIYCGYMMNASGELIRSSQVEKGLVSFETWKQAQEVLNDKKKAPARAQVRFLPFRGLLFCGHCGGKLVSGTDKTGTFYYCKEGANLLKNDACRASRLVHSTEKENWTGLKEAVSPLLAMALLADVEKEQKRLANAEKLDSLKAELANLETKIEKVTGLFMQGLYTESQLEKALAGFKARAQELNAEIASAENSGKADEAKKHLASAGAKFQAFALKEGEISDSDFAVYLRQVIKSIYSFADYIRITTIYGTFDLPRYIYKNRRNFPKAELVINGKAPEDFRFIVRYSTGEKRLLADFGKMKIETI